MHARIIAIGTSKGVRIPKYLLDKYHFENLVELDDTGNGLLLRPIKQPREGWSTAFKTAAKTSQDSLIETPASEWDDQEWEW